MRNKTIIFTLFFVMIAWQNVFAVPELKLPFPGGETWWCSQGNSNCSSSTERTHYIGGASEYAWDFNFGVGSNDLGKSVVAPAKGTIKYAQNSSSGWGNVVIIDYGGNSYGKIAHLDIIAVTENQKVAQGEVIGYCGGTGGWPSHIHYQTQNSDDVEGQSIESSFSDVSTNDGVPLGCDCTYDDGNHRYTSGNYFIPMYSYTFLSRSSEGWTNGNNTTFYCGTDNTTTFKIDGSNPGVYSPVFNTDTEAGDTIVQIRVKITGVSSYALGAVYMKDQTGYWSNYTSFYVTADGEYCTYTLYLSEVADPSDLVKQLEIRLTSGSTGGTEYWEFDWVRVIYTGPPPQTQECNAYSTVPQFNYQT